MLNDRNITNENRFNLNKYSEHFTFDTTDSNQMTSGCSNSEHES